MLQLLLLHVPPYDNRTVRQSIDSRDAVSAWGLTVLEWKAWVWIHLT